MQPVLPLLLSLLLQWSYAVALPTLPPSAGGETRSNVTLVDGERISPGTMHFLDLRARGQPVVLRLGNWGTNRISDWEFGAIVQHGLLQANQSEALGKLHKPFMYRYRNAWVAKTWHARLYIYNLFIEHTWPMTWETFRGAMLLLEHFHEHYMAIDCEFDIYEGHVLLGQGNMTAVGSNKPVQPIPPPSLHPAVPDHRIPSPPPDSPRHGPRPLLGMGMNATGLEIIVDV